MQILRTDRPLTPSWDLIKPSYRLVRENIWPMFYLYFLPSLFASVALVLVNDGMNSDGSIEITTPLIVGFIMAMVSVLVSLMLYPGLVYLQIKAVMGEHPSASESFKKGIKRFWPFIGVSLLGGLLIALGLIALIVPGLILIRGFLLAPYYVIDQNLGPVQALKRSFADSKPHAGFLWGVIGVSIVFSALSSLVQQIAIIGPILGLLITLIYVFAPSLRYGEIVKNIKVRADTPAA